VYNEKIYSDFFGVECLFSCQSQIKQQTMDSTFKVQHSDNEWKNLLTPLQYYVLRQKGTERPFTGQYTDLTDSGTYICAGCKNELFKSDTKFHSGCGWPSFFDVENGKVVLAEDRSHGMVRTEVLCAQCGGHLGHVFSDGPAPTKLRYCINSEALIFVSANRKP
jgi:peptide-methionine (R)-S-oxide reductase